MSIQPPEPVRMALSLAGGPFPKCDETKVQCQGQDILDIGKRALNLADHTGRTGNGVLTHAAYTGASVEAFNAHLSEGQNLALEIAEDCRTMHGWCEGNRLETQYAKLTAILDILSLLPLGVAGYFLATIVRLWAFLVMSALTEALMALFIDLGVQTSQQDDGRKQLDYAKTVGAFAGGLAGGLAGSGAAHAISRRFVTGDNGTRIKRMFQAGFISLAAGFIANLAGSVVGKQAAAATTANPNDGGFSWKDVEAGVPQAIAGAVFDAVLGGRRTTCTQKLPPHEDNHIDYTSTLLEHQQTEGDTPRHPRHERTLSNSEPVSATSNHGASTTPYPRLIGELVDVHESQEAQQGFVDDSTEAALPGSHRSAPPTQPNQQTEQGSTGPHYPRHDAVDAHDQPLSQDPKKPMRDSPDRATNSLSEIDSNSSSQSESASRKETDPLGTKSDYPAAAPGYSVAENPGNSFSRHIQDIPMTESSATRVASDVQHGSNRDIPVNLGPTPNSSRTSGQDCDHERTPLAMRLNPGPVSDRSGVNRLELLATDVRAAEPSPWDGSDSKQTDLSSGTDPSNVDRRMQWVWTAGDDLKMWGTRERARWEAMADYAPEIRESVLELRKDLAGYRTLVKHFHSGEPGVGEKRLLENPENLPNFIDKVNEKLGKSSTRGVFPLRDLPTQAYTAATEAEIRLKRELAPGSDLDQRLAAWDEIKQQASRLEYAISDAEQNHHIQTLIGELREFSRTLRDYAAAYAGSSVSAWREVIALDLLDPHVMLCRPLLSDASGKFDVMAQAVVGHWFEEAFGPGAQKLGIDVVARAVPIERDAMRKHLKDWFFTRVEHLLHESHKDGTHFAVYAPQNDSVVFKGCALFMRPGCSISRGVAIAAHEGVVHHHQSHRHKTAGVEHLVSAKAFQWLDELTHTAWEFQAYVSERPLAEAIKARAADSMIPAQYRPNPISKSSRHTVDSDSRESILKIMTMYGHYDPENPQRGEKMLEQLTDNMDLNYEKAEEDIRGVFTGSDSSKLILNPVTELFLADPAGFVAAYLPKTGPISRFRRIFGSGNS